MTKVKKKVAILLTACLAIGLTACGSSQGLVLVQRSQSETQNLQAYCRMASIVGPETQRADTLLLKSQHHLKDGDEDVAQMESETAYVLYRLAVAHHELAESEAQVDALKKALAHDNDQAQTYQEILQEVKTMRKP